MITILTATAAGGSTPRLTKTFSLTSAGDIEKRDYDRAYTFDAASLDANSIAELSEALTFLEAKPHSCIVRGETVAGTENIRRTLHDDDKGPATLRPVAGGLPWVMLDFDKLPVASLNLADNAARLAYLVSLLPSEFHHASFHYQWSSSAGMDGWATLSCHLWFWLDAPWLCRDLYERFDKRGDFKDCEVDPAPFTPNQVHYTASPIFDGLVDPVETRSGFVPGAYDEVALRPWVRVVEPYASVSDREHYRTFGLARFEQCLDDIGPHFHRPILRAAAHYVAVVPAEQRDLDYLFDRLREAIQAAPTGRARREDYLDRHYLDRVIKGAVRKWGAR